jgi:DNA-binding transcriptional regulator GbsR (MarR family)
MTEKDESNILASMDEARRHYVEDFGLLFEGFGLSRVVWRVLGALLVCPPERSAEELAG